MNISISQTYSVLLNLTTYEYERRALAESEINTEKFELQFSSVVIGSERVLVELRLVQLKPLKDA